MKKKYNKKTTKIHSYEILDLQVKIFVATFQLKTKQNLEIK